MISESSNQGRDYPAHEIFLEIYFFLLAGITWIGNVTDFQGENFSKHKIYSLCTFLKNETFIFVEIEKLVIDF